MSNGWCVGGGCWIGSGAWRGRGCGILSGGPLRRLNVGKFEERGKLEDVNVVMLKRVIELMHGPSAGANLAAGTPPLRCGCARENRTQNYSMQTAMQMRVYVC